MWKGKQKEGSIRAVFSIILTRRLLPDTSADDAKRDSPAEPK